MSHEALGRVPAEGAWEEVAKSLYWPWPCHGQAQAPGTWYLAPGVTGPWYLVPVPGTRDQFPDTRDQFLDTRDKFPGTRDLGIWKRGPRGLETRDRDLENAKKHIKRCGIAPQGLVTLVRKEALRD